MSVLSLPFLILVLMTSVISWQKTSISRTWIIACANLCFFVLLRPSWIHILYFLGLWLYTYWISSLKKGSIFLAISPLVVGLCYYKYAGYLIGHSLFMPLGISFFTFKAIHLVVDVYQEKMESHSILEVFDYLYFFPTLLAGPIHKGESFFEELRKPFQFDYLDQKNGFLQMVLGLFEKLVIADYLSSMYLIYMSKEFSGWYTIFGMVLYSFYIYTDFDSYSNVAIGIARMLGFHFERNFFVPYCAESLSSFWRRWHISLSTWLREYIYFPLGGNRKWTLRKWINTIIVFLVSGIWHGSTIVFVLWGLGHGIVSVLEDMLSVQKLNKNVILKGIGILINFVIVTLLWVFFQASSLSYALLTYQKMSQAFTMPLSQFHYDIVGITRNQWHWLRIVLLLVVGSDILRNRQDMINALAKQKTIVRWVFYVLLIAIALVFGVYGPGYNPQDFIYVTF